MLRLITRSDWRKSRPHLLLLSKFSHPQNPEDYAISDVWKEVLDEPPKVSIKRFISDGMLMASGLDGQLSYKYKVTELKDMLKQRGLAVSGRKDEMIQRLMQADTEGMKKAAGGLSLLECTAIGHEVVAQYIAVEKEKRARVEQEVLEHLNRRKFKEASMTVATYEAEQVFPRGLGIDWKHHNPDRDIEILNLIFRSKPKIIAKLGDDKLPALRLGAGMMALWGRNSAKEWLPADFDVCLPIDNDAAARMLLFYASHQVTLDQYQKSRITKYVRILAAHDSCEACKKLTNGKYRLSEVPEVPHEHCTHQMGCRCTVAAVFD